MYPEERRNLWTITGQMGRRTMKFSDELERILGDGSSANPVTLVESSEGCVGLKADDFAQEDCLGQVLTRKM